MAPAETGEPSGPDSERLRTLLEVTNALVSNLERPALFHAIAQAIRRVVPFERTAIFLRDREREVLALSILESSLPSAYFAVGLEVSLDDSHIGRVVRERAPLVRRDLESEREYPAEDLAHGDGVRSYVVVPLVARDVCIGALAVASTRPGQYTMSDVRFLQEIAGQVALAVDNMQSYEQLELVSRRAHALAERYRALLDINNAIITHRDRGALFQAIVQALRPVLDFQHAALTLLDPRSSELVLAAVEGRALPEPIGVGSALDRRDTYAGWVFEHRRWLVRGDITAGAEFSTQHQAIAVGLRAVCVAPLLRQDRCIGTLNLASTAPDRYAEDHGRFLQEVANQVALAVENLQAYEEIGALKARLEHENVYLQEEISREHNFVEMVGSSPALLATLRRVEQVAPTDATVLVYGETGVGKELIARAIHGRSRRRDRPLVKVNCAAISAGLVESELFGHVKGAFTGAIDRRVGRFELADGGTLFLDEVGELPLETQVKLLRVLQEQEFEPVGSSRTVRVEVRVIAATNRDLREAVEAGRFRADLYYRLNVFPLEVPPLRERPADIPQLATFFLAQSAKSLGKPLEAISAESMQRLVRYAWPGNVRELQNVIERAAILSAGPTLELDRDLLLSPSGPEAPAAGSRAPAPAAAAPSGDGAAPMRTLEEMERAHILAALEQAAWRVEGPRGAANSLAIHPNTLRSRMDKLGIKRPRPGIS